MKGKLLFLGSGASTGVPVIGCECKVCKSTSHYNKRLRPSVLIKIKDKTILIDSGPDIREQALRYNIDKIDALILTHIHYDHIAGIDDLRIYYYMSNKAIPCLVSDETLEELKLRYHYLFRPIGEITTISAQFDFHMLDEKKGEFNFEGIKIKYFSYFQNTMKITGIRIGDLAYVTDIKEYDEIVFDSLKNLDTLILGALRYETSLVHFNIEEAQKFAKRVNAKKVFLTHLGHEIDYNNIEGSLDKMKFGYDGLELEFNYEDACE